MCCRSYFAAFYRRGSLGGAFLITLLILAQSLQSAVQLPYANDFETSDGVFNGDASELSDWNVPLGLSTSVSFDAASGLQSLSVFGDADLSVSLFESGPSSSVAWVDFFLKPVVVDETNLPQSISPFRSAVVGFVHAAESGEVFVIDGDGFGGGQWLASGAVFPVSSGLSDNWLRLSYRLDFVTKRWDLFMDGQIVLADTGFLDNSVSSLTDFTLRSSADLSAGLDFFYSGILNPLYLDTSNDGLPDSWLVAQGLNVNINQRLFDNDFDGLTNLQEFQLSTLGTDPDTDADGINDGVEVSSGADPSNFDVYALSLVPFFEDFESIPIGNIDGVSNWSVSGGLAEVSIAASLSGAQSLEVKGNSSLDLSVRLPFDGSDDNVAWVDFELRPVLFDTGVSAPSSLVEGESSTVFYFDSDQNLVAFNGLSQSFIEAPVSWNPSGWQRVTVYLDYTAQTWSIWLNDLLVFSDFGFANPQPYFSNLKLLQESELPGFLDDISVSFTMPAGLDSDNDGLDDDLEISIGTDPRSPDSDGDGLADLYEYQNGLDPLVDDSGSDLDGDGQDNATEFANGTDPQDYYDQFPAVTAAISIISGDNQTSPPDAFVSEPIVVEVTDSITGNLLVNAPFTALVQQGGGLLALTDDGSGLTSSLSGNSDLAGRVSVYYQQPSSVGTVSQIDFQAGGALVSATTTVLSVPAGLKLEHGVLPIVRDSWQRVTLLNTYADMVVIATPQYGLGSPPLVTRIRNASGNRFEIKVQNPGGVTDVSNTVVSVHYFVVEAGVYSIANEGLTMEAFKYDPTITDGAVSGLVGEQITPQNTYSSPVVLGQVMTYNDSRYSSFWARGSTRKRVPDSSNIFVGKQIGQDTDTARLDETLGVVIIEATASLSSVLGYDYLASVGTDSIEGFEDTPSSAPVPPYTYPLSGLSSAGSRVLSSAAFDGNTGSWPMLYGDNALSDSLDIAVDVDQIASSQRRSTTEQVAYLAFNDVLIDSDSDLMDDRFELRVVDFDLSDSLNTISDVFPGDDFDGDLQSNLTEYQNGTQAFDYYDQSPAVDPVIQVVSGDSQRSDINTFLPLPIELTVTDSISGNPLQNAPVLVSVASGGGLVSVANDGTQLESSMTLYTDASGYVSFYYQQPGTYATVSELIMSAAQTQASVTAGSLAPPADRLIVETGILPSVTGDWQQVTLLNTYSDPVVIATPQYEAAEGPAVPRIRNASGNTFEIKLQNPGDVTGSASFAYPVHYVVVNAGTYTEPIDGVKMEAFTYNSTITDSPTNSLVGEAIAYQNVYSNPIVLGQVMTENDPDWSSFWARGSNAGNPASASDLYIGKHVGQDVDITRNAETLGVLVLEQSTGISTMNGISYFAALSSDTVEGYDNNPPYTFALSGFSTTGARILSSAGMDGGNNNWSSGAGWPILYGNNENVGALDIVVDEDQIGNTGRGGTTQQVAYLVFSDEMIDTDADGMDDRYELIIVNFDLSDEFNTIDDILPGDDFDGDSQTNLTEYQNETQAVDYYDQSPAVNPSLLVSKGNGQRSDINTFLPLPVELTVTDTISGNPLPNAPVAVSVTSGGGSVSTTNDGTGLNTSTTLYTDASGFLSFYYQQPSTYATVSEITIRVEELTSIVQSATLRAPDDRLLIESGVIPSVQTAWQLVTLIDSVNDMVVVATPQYGEGDVPVVARVRNASGNTFEIKLQSPGGVSNPSLIDYPVHYVVARVGHYNQLIDGIEMDVFKMLSTVTDSAANGFVGEQANFVGNYSENPVVLGQVMSDNDANWSVFWARGQAKNHPPRLGDFYIGKHVGEDSNVARADEQLGVIVLERATTVSQINGQGYLATVGSDSIRGFPSSGQISPYQYAISGLSDPAVRILSVAGLDDANGGWPVLYGANDQNNAVGIVFDEDLIGDANRGHTTEQVAYLVLNQQTLDTDGDGMDDSYELTIVDADLNDSINDINDVLPGDDFDGDSQTNLEEYLNGSVGIDYYSQAPAISPDISIFSGDRQRGDIAAFVGAPLSVQVVDAVTGNPLQNAPVDISVRLGGGLVSSTNDGLGLAGDLEIRTDNAGRVEYYFQGPSTYATISEVDAFAGSDSVTFTMGTQRAPADTLKIESGILDSVGKSWQTVTLTNTYTDPVIVATPQLFAGDIPVVARIRNSGGNTFQIRLRNPGTVSSENQINYPVHFLVVESGQYIDVIDGVFMEAFRYTTSITDGFASGFIGEQISYQNSYTSPVVLGQVMTHRSTAWSVFWARGGGRQHPPTPSNLFVGKHVGEDSNAVRNGEDVGVIVFEGTDTAALINDYSYLAGVGSDSISGFDNNSAPFSYSIEDLNTQTVRILSVAGLDNSTEGGWPVLFGPNASRTSLDIVIDEDQIADTERSHGTEQVAYLVIEAPAEYQVGDTDNDGIDDVYEQIIIDADPNDSIQNFIDVIPEDDFDGDGQSNLAEFLNETDSTDYYSQSPAVSPQLLLMSGDYQNSAVSTYVAQPTVAQLINSVTGLPLVNAPINITVSTGDGQVSVSNDGIGLTNTQELRTDSSGNLQFYFYQPSTFGTVTTVNVSGPSTVLPLTFGSNRAPDDLLKIETGIIPSVTSKWQRVGLLNDYDDGMVVVATPRYTSSSIPAVVRIRNAQDNTFEIRLQNPGSVSDETTLNYPVHYVVIQEGIYNDLIDGYTLEAFKHESLITDGKTVGWVGESVGYHNNYTSPVVFGQVMTFNDADWSSFWARGTSRQNPPNASNLFIGKHVGRDTNTVRANETLGVIVIESEASAVSISDSQNTFAYLSGLTLDIIQGVSDSPAYQIDVGGSLSNAGPRILSSAAMDDTDGGWPVLYGSNTNRRRLDTAIDRDQINGNVRNSNTEQVAYWMFEDQIIDLDGDLMDDRYELLTVSFDLSDEFNTIDDIHPGEDFDGDNQSNLAEYQNGTRAFDYYDQSPAVNPMIQILSGDSQRSDINTFLPLPIELSVVDSISGNPLPNAPVAVSVVLGGGNVSTINDGSGLSSSVTLYTDASGFVSFYYQQSSTYATVSELLISAGQTEATVTAGSLAVPADRLVVETGILPIVTGDWQVVTLLNTYSDPVVIATPQYGAAAGPAVPRIRNASGNTFEIKLQNPGDITGSAAFAYPVHYVVVNAGTYTEPIDGVKLEAFTFSSMVTDSPTNGFVGEAITYQNAYSNPVVLGQVMTSNDPDWSSFWARGSNAGNPASANDLYVGKHVGQDVDTTRSAETLGVIVLEETSEISNMNGIDYFAALSTDTVAGYGNSPPYTFALGGFATTGARILSSAGMDGGNNNWNAGAGWPILYQSNQNPGNLDIAIDEDQIGNTGRNGTTQQVAYLVFADQFIDTDLDGMDDRYELLIVSYDLSDSLNTIFDVLPTADFDGDSQNNLTEYQQGTDAIDYFSQIPAVSPAISIVGGEGQFGLVETYTEEPLVVSVIDTISGNPLLGAPVEVSINGEGQVSLLNDDVGLSATVTIETDAQGQASIYFKRPATTFVTSDVIFSAGDQSVGIQVATSSTVQGDLVIETGILEGVSDQWQLVTLNESYDEMVVVATPQYVTVDVGYTPPPAVTRIRNVTTNSFEVKLQNPGDLVSLNAADYNVHYIAVDAGTYTEEFYGLDLEAYRVDSSITDGIVSGFTGQTGAYQNAYTTPVVLGQVMSANDANWSVFWAAGPSPTLPTTNSALTIGKHVGEDPQVTRANETLGVIVLDTKTSNSTEIEIDYLSSRSTSLRDKPAYFFPNADFAEDWVRIASSNGIREVDGSWPVINGQLDDTALRFYFDNDQIADSERFSFEYLASLVIEDSSYYLDSDGDGLADGLEQEIIDSDPNDSFTTLAHVHPGDDFDGDGLSNLEELTARTDPVLADTDSDGLLDGDELYGDGSHQDLDGIITDPLDPDVDDDGILDGEEVFYALDPLDPRDAQDDNDGDRIPNVYEIRNGMDLNLPGDSLTGSALIVDPLMGAGYTHTAINAAVDSLTQDYQIILVRDGIYDETPDFHSGYQFLILSANGPQKTIIRGTQGIVSYSVLFEVRSKVVVDGFTLRPQNKDIYAILGVHTGAEGSIFRRMIVTGHDGFRTFQIYTDDVTFESSLIVNNTPTSSVFFITTAQNLSFNHVTVANNNIGEISARLFSLESFSSINFENSIIWGETVENSEIDVDVNASFVQSDSVIIGGYGGALDVDPALNLEGYLTSNSPVSVLDALTLPGTISADINLEAIPFGAGLDIGADEWVDNDNGDGTGDGLPDWWELSIFGDLLTANTTSDFDADGITDFDEYLINSDPLDPSADIDNDGIFDAEEILYGFDPFTDDGFENADGDRIPNVFEIRNGLDPLVSGDTIPASAFIVDPTMGAGYTHTTITSAAASVSQDYQIILVRDGMYDEHVDIDSSFKLLILSENGPKYTTIRGTSTGQNFIFETSSRIALDGFTLSPLREDVNSILRVFSGADGSAFKRLIIEGHYGEDQTIYLTADNVVFERSLIVGNSSSEEIFYLGGAENLLFRHLTIANNNRGKSSARLFYLVSGASLAFENGIIWGESVSNSEVYVIYDSSFTATSSVIIGGYGGALDIDPALNPEGYLTSNSPASIVDALNIPLSSTYDINLETAPFGSGLDIGADEWVDNDNGDGTGDGLPDWWELSFFGDLLTANAVSDSDGDGLSDLEELTAGTDPVLVDTDSDGLLDGDELYGDGSHQDLDGIVTDPLDPDVDDDGILDGEEVFYALDPLDPRDALNDNDGDRIPNVYELRNGMDFNFSGDPLTGSALIVDPLMGAGYTHTAIHAAVDSLTQDYQIILVRDGVYDESPDFPSDYRFLILSENGPQKTTIRGTLNFNNNILFAVRSKVAVDGFTINPQDADIDTILRVYAGAEGSVFRRMIVTGNNGGFRTFYTTADDVTFERSIIASNTATYSVFYSSGAQNLSLNHVTITRNNIGEISAHLFSLRSFSSINVENSIIWGETVENSQIYVDGSSSFAQLDSVIIGGYGGALDIDPALNLEGYLTSNSPAFILDALTLPGTISTDINLETVPFGAGLDIGADEWVDNDNGDGTGDGVPDWWELSIFGDLLTANDISDSDGDGLVDANEYLINSDPFDPSADIDNDGISDAEEILYGFDPFTDDGFEDADGDRIPNVFEIRNGLDPLVSGDSLPASAFIVDPTMGAGYTHTTITSAVNSVSQDYQIIWVRDGIYEEQVDIDSSFKLLILSENGPKYTTIRGTTNTQFIMFTAHSRIALDGFTLSPLRGDVDSILSVSQSADGSTFKRLIIKGHNYGGDETINLLADNLIFERCLIVGNSPSSEEIFRLVGTENLLFRHVTIAHNNAGLASARLFAVLSNSSLEFENSIIWGESVENSEIYVSGSSFTATSSVIIGGYGGALDIDPALNFEGYLTSNSPASIVDALNIPLSSTYDINLETAPFGSGLDIGADEWIDNDNGDETGDGLPDWWEIQNVGNLSSLSALMDDLDFDGMNAEYEYLNGLLPHVWEGAQNWISPAVSVYDAEQTPPIGFSFEVFSAQDIQIDFWELEVGLDGNNAINDATTSYDTANGPLHSVTLSNVQPGTYSDLAVWDGINAEGDYHRAKVLQFTVVATQVGGEQNTDLTVPFADYSGISLSETLGEISASFSYYLPTTWWQTDVIAQLIKNASGRLTVDVGSNYRLLLNNRLHQSLLSVVPMYGNQYVSDEWVIIGDDGDLPYDNLAGTRTDPTLIENRILPENTILFANHELNAIDYTVDGFQAVPSFNGSATARFGLNRAASVSLQLIDPTNTKVFGLYFYNNEDQTTDTAVSEIVLQPGEHKLHFLPVNFSDADNWEMFGPSNARHSLSYEYSSDGQFRVRITAIDEITGEVRYEYAHLKVDFME